MVKKITGIITRVQQDSTMSSIEFAGKMPTSPKSGMHLLTIESSDKSLFMQHAIKAKISGGSMDEENVELLLFMQPKISLVLYKDAAIGLADSIQHTQKQPNVPIKEKFKKTIAELKNKEAFILINPKNSELSPTEALVGTQIDIVIHYM